MRITVLLGGASAERNVSIASGLRIAAALRSRGHAVTCLDPTGDVLSSDEEKRLGATAVGATPPTPDELAALAERLKPSFAERPEVREAEVVFIGLHGGSGEDGTIQSLLEMAGVPYTGSGPMASAIAMDKDISKILFRAAAVQTADWTMAPRSPDAVWLRDCLTTIGLPLIVKPSKQGSTVGLTVVKQEAQLAPAVAEAFRYDDEVMVERFVAGRELTVGVIGGDGGASSGVGNGGGGGGGGSGGFGAIVTGPGTGRGALYSANRASPIFSELQAIAVKLLGGSDLLREAVTVNDAVDSLVPLPTFGGVALG